MHYRSSRSASTGVREAAREAGISDAAMATNRRAVNATSVVVMLTGRPGNMSGIGTSVSSAERPNATDQPISAADQRKEHAFQEEVEQHAPLGRSQGFADTDFAGAFGHGHEHDVHDPDAAQAESDDRNRAEKHVIDWKMASTCFAFSTVSQMPIRRPCPPDRSRGGAEHSHHLSTCRFECIERTRVDR